MSCAPCIAAWGEDVARDYCPPHTESQIRLWQDDESDEKTGWFMDDAEAADDGQEGDGWIVEERPSWRDNPVISIQGVLYALDINAEGQIAIEPLASLQERRGPEHE